MLLFLISEGAIGKKYDAKKIQTGEVFVKLHSKQQTSTLKEQTRIGDIDIRVTPHGSLNTSQGVISEGDLINKTGAEFWEA